ncbi:MAG: hypothetical protein DRJ05_08480 [Bacteroidetes bacterium]|nr:MAG: hypothetical protein DRJ05_08480 [Bacteroidota bacterium]
MRFEKANSKTTKATNMPNIRDTGTGYGIPVEIANTIPTIKGSNNLIKGNWCQKFMLKSTNLF